MRIYHKLKMTALASIVLSGIVFGTAAQARDYFKDGCAYYKAGHYDHARKCFEFIARTEPKNWAAHYQLANTYLKLGERMKARAAYDACIRKLPDLETAKACQKAIEHIDLQTANEVIAADKAKSADTEETKPKEKKLSLEEIRRMDRLSAEKQAYKDKVATLKAKKDEIMREARKEAARIKAEAKERLAEMSRNTNQYVQNSRTGEVRLGVPDSIALPILREAEQRARSVMHQAETRARGIQIPPNPFRDN